MLVKGRLRPIGFVLTSLVVRSIARNSSIRYPSKGVPFMNSKRSRHGLTRTRVLVALLAILFAATTLIHQMYFARRASADTTSAVSISSLGTAVTQDFNSLVSSGTGTLAANTPTGWG